MRWRRKAMLRSAKSIVSVSLEVRESNSTAISLYQKKGFVINGRRPHFYKNPSEAALIMTAEISKAF